MNVWVVCICIVMLLGQQPVAGMAALDGDAEQSLLVNARINAVHFKGKSYSIIISTYQSSATEWQIPNQNLNY